MSKQLSQIAQNQLSASDVKGEFLLVIAGIDYSDYLISWNISFSAEYGSASASFSLLNEGNMFGEGGSSELKVGDVVAFTQYFEGSNQEFPKFYGIINQRSVTINNDQQEFSMICLDYISVLQFQSIDLDIEGTKVQVLEEKLTANFLPEPNQALAQVFDFANDNVAQVPKPTLMIRGRTSSFAELAYDGFEIQYPTGQVKMGFPVNALYNYDLYSPEYYFYTQGLHVEDVIETLLTLQDSYGGYLFGETTAQAVIDNHLTTTFSDTEDRLGDTLTPNITTSTIVIKHQLAQDYDPDGSLSDYLYLDSVEGLPESGTASINGDTFSWTSIGSGNVLEGLTDSGSYALSTHTTNSYLAYEAEYAPYQVWYFSYSNVQSTLTSTDFTLPTTGVAIDYIDYRNGRILLDGPLTALDVPTLDVDYTFKTLQATGIEMNSIQFRSRDVDNRFEALKKVFKYLAPNYHVRTVGDEKIWASYLYQKVTPDYTLQLATGLQYLEDEDLYTRVVFYGKNNNPTNIMFKDGVQFETTGNNYKALASNTELALLNEGLTGTEQETLLPPVVDDLVLVNNFPTSSEAIITNYYTYGVGETITTDYETVDDTRNAVDITTESLSGIATDVPWVNPTNAQYEEGDTASCVIPAGNTTDFLTFTNWGFSLPSDAAFKGITVIVSRKGVGVVDNNVTILKNGQPVGTNNAKPTEWPSVLAVATYGGTTATWAVTWLPEEINNSGFGVAISATSTAGGTAEIDYVTLMISYTVGGTTSESAIGMITADRIIPIVYINGVPIDNQPHVIVGQQILLETTTRTDTTSSGGK